MLPSFRPLGRVRPVVSHTPHPPLGPCPLRRHLLGALGGVLLAGLCGCRDASARVLNVASHAWLGNEFLFFARDQGWLNDSGARLVELPAASESLHALAAGLVDGATLTLDEMLRARAAGLPLTAVLVFDVSSGADVILGRPGMNRPADLAGRRVGVESSAAGALLLRLALESAGLDIRAVTPVPLMPSEQAEAWRSGRIDALVTYQPLTHAIESEGAVRLFDSRTLPNTLLDVLAVQPRAIHAHGAALRHLIAAHFRALAHFRQNPLDAGYRLAPHLGLPPPAVLNAYKGLLLPDVAENRRQLGGSAPILRESARELSARMRRAGLLTREDALLDLVDASLLPQGGPA